MIYHSEKGKNGTDIGLAKAGLTVFKDQYPINSPKP